MDWAKGSDAARGARACSQPQTAADPGMGPGVLDVEGYRGLLRSSEDALDAVDRALVQLDEGSYGTCTECGLAIDDARLEADPTLQQCARHDAAATDAPLTP